VKFHGFCLFVLLSTSPAIQAQPTLAKESDENLDKQAKALEQQIKALEAQIDKLRKQQAPLLAEQAARAAKRWGLEAKTHFAKAEIRGTLRKSKGAKGLPLRPAGPEGSLFPTWLVVVNGRSWEVHFPEKDKVLLAAAAKLINKRVVITGTASYTPQQEPAVPVYPPYGLYGPVPRYRPPSYLFVVAAQSLQLAATTASNADDKKMQKSMEAVRARIAMLSRKGDDITRRESFELIGLEKTLEKLSKELEARQQYAKVQFRGKLLTGGLGAWQVQIGSFGNWNLDFGPKNERMALARGQEGKRVVLTGTITADPWAHPSVNVESLKRAEE
jgi:hypothetical protein